MFACCTVLLNILIHRGVVLMWFGCTTYHQNQRTIVAKPSLCTPCTLSAFFFLGWTAPFNFRILH